MIEMSVCLYVFVEWQGSGEGSHALAVYVIVIVFRSLIPDWPRVSQAAGSLLARRGCVANVMFT